MSSLYAALFRELLLGLRHPSDSLNPMVFFLIVVSIFSLGLVGIPLDQKADIAITVLWVATLFAVFLPLDRTFYQDNQDGTLELILSEERNLLTVVLGYGLARWLLNGLPILLTLPLAAWMLNLDTKVWLLLIGTLGIGSVVFVIFGQLGSSLTLGVERNGVLMALLVLPLYIPVVLLGIGIAQRSLLDESFGGALAALGAIAIATATFVPFGTATLLRNSQEY